VIYAAIGGLLLWAASLAGTAWWFYDAGQDKCEAAQARDDRVAAVATEAAASAAAAAIAKVKVVNRTIQQEVQREVSERVVYRDCQHSPGQLQLINAALAGAKPEPAGRGFVPRADALGRSELRGDNPEAGGSGGAVP
jgi:hypothetical protein